MRLFTAVIIAAIAAPSLARDTPRVPAAVAAGTPQSCVPLNQIDQSLVRDDRVIDFRMRNGRYYRVTLTHACPGLGVEGRFRYATALHELCSTDIITVFSTAPMMDGASCGLAPFQPVTLAPR